MPKFLYFLLAFFILALVYAADNKAGIWLAGISLIALLINRSSNLQYYYKR